MVFALILCWIPTSGTIGFGDLVPGASVVGSDSSQEKLVICSLYLLTGIINQSILLLLHRITKSLDFN